MSKEAHESIKADLARHGVTHDDHVSAALDAHDLGVDVQSVLDAIKAGVPSWLALLAALRDAGVLGRAKKAPAKAGAKKPAE